MLAAKGVLTRPVQKFHDLELNEPRIKSISSCFQEKNQKEVFEDNEFGTDKQDAFTHSMNIDMEIACKGV